MNTVSAYVTVWDENVELVIFTDNYLLPKEDTNGYLKVTNPSVEYDNQGNYTVQKEYFVDNLSYLLNIDKERKKEIKTELKSMNLYYPGVIKNIKNCVSHMKKLGYLNASTSVSC